MRGRSVDEAERRGASQLYQTALVSREFGIGLLMI